MKLFYRLFLSLSILALPVLSGIPSASAHELEDKDQQIQTVSHPQNVEAARQKDRKSVV